MQSLILNTRNRLTRSDQDPVRILVTGPALCGMATAAHTSVNPLRGPGEATQAGQALAKAMSALEEAAKDVHRHRTIGELMGMTN